MGMRLVSSTEKCYEVAQVSGLACESSQAAPPAPAIRRALLVMTPTVSKLYGPRLQAWLESGGAELRTVVLPLHEGNKSIAVVEEICAQSVEHGLGRTDAIVAAGGGICTDVVGVAASLVRRGIRHIRIPTTLVGQIDAGIGLKAGVNFLNRKNYVGCFHPPAAVYVDPSFLRSLTLRHTLQGLSEIVKIAVVADRSLFELVAEQGAQLVRSRFQSPRRIAAEVINRSIDLMLTQLESNPHEDRSLQRLVDMGHTFSPTLEEESGFTIRHGDAVAIDMALTCRLGVELGWTDDTEAGRIIGLLEHLGLPIWSPLLGPGLCRKAIDFAAAHRGGKVNLVVPVRIGEARFLEDGAALTRTAFAKVLAELEQRARQGTRTPVAGNSGAELG